MIVELCGDVREFLALIGLCDEVLDGAIEGIQTAAGSIGQDELEAPGLADARDRRRGEYDDIGFLDRGEQPVEPIRHALHRVLKAFAL